MRADAGFHHRVVAPWNGPVVLGATTARIGAGRATHPVPAMRCGTRVSHPVGIRVRLIGVGNLWAVIIAASRSKRGAADTRIVAQTFRYPVPVFVRVANVTRAQVVVRGCLFFLYCVVLSPESAKIFMLTVS